MADTCVNRDSKEFKDTVSRLDVHPDYLEVALHKLPENPTDEQIMAELDAKPFKPNDLERRYIELAGLHKRQLFGNRKKAEEHFAELQTMFDDEKLSMYRDSKGNYVVTVGKFIEPKPKPVVQTAQPVQSSNTVTYRLKGQDPQTYTVEGSHIYNSKGTEVFKEAGKHRNKIFANLAVQQHRAVVVEHHDKKYVVNKKGVIISGTTGDVMKWGEENGDRKAIISKANEKFSSMSIPQAAPQSISAPKYTPVTKIISGGQTGVDTIGLQVAKSLGIETGGTAPKGFKREEGYDAEDISSYGLVEITDDEQNEHTSRTGKTDPYTGRTALNVKNSDGTVYFYTKDDIAGKRATERAAKELGKPFLLNPTAAQLQEWLKQNNIHTLNVAGNRGTRLPSDNRVAKIIKKALSEDIQGQAAQKAVQTHNETLKVLGGTHNSEAKKELTDTIKTIKKGLAFEGALSTVSPVFNDTEIAQIKQALNGRPLTVTSVSRFTDSAFFSDQIIKALEENAKKPFTDPTRINAIEIWSKHDGMPIKNILLACKKYKVAPMVSFSITGLGDTALERGVLKYRDLLPLIKELIDTKVLDPRTTTIRIDPILVGYTDLNDIKNIVEMAKSMGIRKFVTSLVQSYGKWDGTPMDRKVTSGIDKALAKEGQTYDWYEYYGRDRNNKVNFHPKQKYIDQVGKFLLELNKDPDIEIETCSFRIKGLPASACLDPLIIERVTGVDITRPDGSYDRDTSRPDCMCYGAHGDMFRMNEKRCYSSCAYCYAAHSQDSSLKYYNDDGTLRDIPYTRTSGEGEFVGKDITPEGATPEGNKPVTSIPQNRISGKHQYGFTQTAKPEVIKALGEGTTSIDMVEAGFRTRTTRSVSESEKYNLKVGDVFEQYGTSKDGTQKKVLTRVTAIYGKNDPRYEGNWSKEGWTDEGISDIRRLKDGATCIEFEVISTPEGTQSKDKPATKEESQEHDKEQLTLYKKNLKELLKDIKGKADVPIKNALKAADHELNALEKAQMEFFNKLYGEDVDEAYDFIEAIHAGVIPTYGEYKKGYSAETGVQITKDVAKIYLQDNFPEYVEFLESKGLDIDGLPIDDFSDDLSEYDKLFDKNGIKEEHLEHKGFADDVEESEEGDITKIRKENQEYMERSQKIRQQLANLTRSPLMTSMEIRHFAEAIAYQISDFISDLMTTDGMIDNHFGEDERWTGKDLSKISRAELIQMIGPDTFIDHMKDLMTPEFNEDLFEDSDDDTIDRAYLLVENWDAVMMLSASTLAEIEDFTFALNRDGERRELKEKKEDIDGFNASNMESEVKETEGNLQEHWQVKNRTIDIFTTMTQKVKQALLECYVLDEDGDYIHDEFGMRARVDRREAANSILRWTQGAGNLETMISRLQEKVKDHPWVQQLVDKLTDDKEVDFKNQFFGTFYKIFQLYSVGTLEDGLFRAGLVNLRPALKEAVNQIITMYNTGNHPLFTSEGINESTLSDLYEAFDDLRASEKRVFGLIQSGTNYYQRKKLYEESNLKEQAAKMFSYASVVLGFPVTPEMALNSLTYDNYESMTGNLANLIGKLKDNLDNKKYDPFRYGTEGILGHLRYFLLPMIDSLEDTAISAFYSKGEMYQSYTIPSFLTKLVQKFHLEGDEYRDFMEKEYKKYPWFYDKETETYRCPWLAGASELQHKVQLSFNSHTYMENMSDVDYTLSMLTEFFSEGKKIKGEEYAWYRIPMLSNKPSAEYLKFYRYDGPHYKGGITDALKRIFDQELMRIQTVEMRDFDKADPRYIKSFEENGKKFMFLQFMNDYLTGSLKNSELGKLIRSKLDGNKVDEAKLNDLAKKAIFDAMEAKAKSTIEKWKANGVFEAAKNIKNISWAAIKGATDEIAQRELENFVWNDTLAAMAILELTITDVAYYKDAGDLQKRLAAIHAPGVRGNVTATDYDGNRVSDGFFRTLKLTDFDYFISNVIDNISVVFDRKIARAKTEEEKAPLRALKEALVGEKGAYRQINVADAQGFSSPTSYRKKAFIFGKWSKNAEEIYQKLKEGKYNYRDLKTAFQPLKPVVSSFATKEAGVEGAPMDLLKVPVYFKNSEYLLIMADALIQGENTGRPNLLRAIYQVMEESHYDGQGNYKTDGIDTVQFESAMKTGLAGKVDLNDLVDNPLGEDIAKARLESAIYETEKYIYHSTDENGEMVEKHVYKRTGNYDNTTVDVVPMEDYCLQQEVPAHFKNHYQEQGSQGRYIIVSELETTDYQGNPVTYELEGKQVSAEEFKKEYEDTVAANIRESIDDLANMLGIDSLNPKDRNICLSRILQEECKSSSRYGVELLQACSVNEDGEFVIPIGDPIQSKRIEQMLNSIIKNRICKQEIAGGPVVQVSNYGTSKELHIRYKDKRGGILKTREEYEKDPTIVQMYDETGNTKEVAESYEEYCENYQGGVAYFEVFASIYTNDLFLKFADHNGVINMEAIEMLDPDLLKMIGYRIPTEDKYSMVPIKIVGFLPREAGDGIMFPYEITAQNGSDFDKRQC